MRQPNSVWERLYNGKDTRRHWSLGAILEAGYHISLFCNIYMRYMYLKRRFLSSCTSSWIIYYLAIYPNWTNISWDIPIILKWKRPRKKKEAWEAVFLGNSYSCGINSHYNIYSQYNSIVILPSLLYGAGAQLSLAPCDPLDCSLPGSSVHGILQARTLEQVAISYSRGSSRPRDRTLISCVSCIGRLILYHCTTWEAPLWNILLSYSQEIYHTAFPFHCTFFFLFNSLDTAAGLLSHRLFYFSYPSWICKWELVIRYQTNNHHSNVWRTQLSLLTHSKKNNSSMNKFTKTLIYDSRDYIWVAWRGQTIFAKWVKNILFKWRIAIWNPAIHNFNEAGLCFPL